MEIDCVLTERTALHEQTLSDRTNERTNKKNNE